MAGVDELGWFGEMYRVVPGTFQISSIFCSFNKNQQVRIDVKDQVSEAFILGLVERPGWPGRSTS